MQQEHQFYSTCFKPPMSKVKRKKTKDGGIYEKSLKSFKPPMSKVKQVEEKDETQKVEMFQTSNE